MKRFDKVFFAWIIGSTFPFLFALLSVIAWFYLDKSENRASIYLAGGLVAGFIVDFKFLKGWIKHLYDLPLWFLTGIYLVYTLGIYGLFMGFPVFNLLLALPAGYYYGKRICNKNIAGYEQSKLIHRISLFTALIMTLICISSGCIALAGIGLGTDIQGMLGLDFTVTKTMIWAITLIGGSGLIALQFLLTKILLIKTIKTNRLPDKKKNFNQLLNV